MLIALKDQDMLIALEDQDTVLIQTLKQGTLRVTATTVQYRKHHGKVWSPEVDLDRLVALFSIFSAETPSQKKKGVPCKRKTARASVSRNGKPVKRRRKKVPTTHVKKAC